MSPKAVAACVRSYDPVEDLELARARVRVSADPWLEVNQTAERFWWRVKQSMEKSEPVASALSSGIMEPRTWTSLQAHFRAVHSIGR
ncbi:hypothetical protein FI667_g5453, partial [Globisporangium splendens]